MDAPLKDLPDWLQAKPERKRKPRNDPTCTVGSYGVLSPFQFEAFFEICLDRICEGQSLTSAMADDVRAFDRAQFVRWINKDPERQRRYHEAQEIGAEIVAAEMIGIADAENSLEDVQRSTLRINTRKYLLSVWNRKRFSETKQIEMSTTISVSKALEQAQQRLQHLKQDVIDVDSREVTCTPEE